MRQTGQCPPAASPVARPTVARRQADLAVFRSAGQHAPAGRRSAPFKILARASAACVKASSWLSHQIIRGRVLTKSPSPPSRHRTQGTTEYVPDDGRFSFSSIGSAGDPLQSLHSGKQLQLNMPSAKRSVWPADAARSSAPVPSPESVIQRGLLAGYQGRSTWLFYTELRPECESINACIT